ncbi:MAG: thioredoxin [Paludibacteraceae bacterium]|nr:thioredoxin [Paludibacteraceae bacterium]
MESFNQIISGTQLVLVDFYATWCGPCKMMHPVLEQLKDQQAERLRIIKIDVDKNPALAAQYQVQSVPTLIAFREGNVLWRQSGALTLSQLIKIVDQL